MAQLLGSPGLRPYARPTPGLDGVLILDGVRGFPCKVHRPWTFSNESGPAFQQLQQVLHEGESRSPPKGARWQAAKPGLEPFLAEVDSMIGDLHLETENGCCVKALNLCAKTLTLDWFGSLHFSFWEGAAKKLGNATSHGQVLPSDANWLNRVNAYLMQHGLTAELYLPWSGGGSAENPNGVSLPNSLHLRIIEVGVHSGSGVPNALQMSK